MGAVTNNVSTKADVFITDEWKGYTTVGKQYRHEKINHIKLEYVAAVILAFTLNQSRISGVSSNGA